MKLYAPAFHAVPFDSRQEKNEPFFETQPFFKTSKSGFRENLQLKWFAPASNDFFFLAIRGLDAKMVKELMLALKSKTRLNLDNCEAENLQGMMKAITEFAEKETAQAQFVDEKLN